MRIPPSHLRAAIRGWQHQTRHRSRRWYGKTPEQQARHLKWCTSCAIWRQDMDDRWRRDEEEWLDWTVFGRD